MHSKDVSSTYNVNSSSVVVWVLWSAENLFFSFFFNIESSPGVRVFSLSIKIIYDIVL